MEIYLSNQLRMLLYSLFLGVFFAIIWDTLRITRVLLGVKYSGKTSEKLASVKLPLISKKTLGKLSAKLLQVLIFIQDFVTFSFFGITCAVFFYYTSDGHWRYFALLGIIAGFIIYYFTVGKIVIAFSSVIVFFLKAVFQYIVFFITYPIKLIIKCSYNAIKAVVAFLCKIFKNIYKEMYIRSFDIFSKRCIIKETDKLFDFVERKYNNAKEKTAKHSFFSNSRSGNSDNNATSISAKRPSKR